MNNLMAVHYKCNQIKADMPFEIMKPEMFLPENIKWMRILRKHPKTRQHATAKALKALELTVDPYVYKTELRNAYKAMMAENILAQFSISINDVFNIYPYGSRVYGCHTDESDHDWVIVYRSAFLPSGSFRDNAISSPDRKHQATCYSRAGFIDAINNYEITALECYFLDPARAAMVGKEFSIHRWESPKMASAVITKSSQSWHKAIADFHKYGNEDSARKGVSHALRILTFGKQMAKTGRIHDYGAHNKLHGAIMSDTEFTPKKYLSMRDDAMEQLRSLADEAHRTIRAQAGERKS